MLIGKINEVTAPAFTFLHGKAGTDAARIAEAGGGIMDRLHAYSKANDFNPVGPSIWMYEWMGNGKVTLKAGMQVAEGTRADGFSIEKVPEWRCEKGFKSLGIREIYREWVTFDSSDNVTELRMKISWK